jgi:RHS repeat-associated protein
LAANNFIAAKTVKELTLNKSFSYNLLNLPATSTFATGSATFAYDAAGSKLRKASTVSGTTTYTDYIAGIQHSGTTSESIEYIMTEEGQAVPNGTTSYNYEYFLGDNLGNTRRTFDISTGAARLVQSDDYYPFGWTVNSLVTGTQNYYLYNKKEQQPEFNEYDYGARFYDPVIARWTSVDPLAEKSRRWSDYNYVMDNPIRLIDPDGMFARIPNGSVGETDEDVDPASDLDEINWAGEKENAAKAADKNADYHVEPDHWAEAEAASNSTTSTATGNLGTAAGVVNSPSPAPGDASQGGGPPLTHAQELAKYGHLVGGINITGTASLGIGGTIEWGWVTTNKNYIQYYYTVYYTNTAALGVGLNAIKINSLKGQNATFSDWVGPVAGGTINYGYVSGAGGFSSSYYYFGGGPGYGVSFKLYGSYSVGYTYMIGQPYLDSPTETLKF